MEIKNEIFSKDSQKYTAYIIDDKGNKIDGDISDFQYEFISQNKLIGNIGHKFISFTLFNASKYNLADKKIKAYIVFEDGDQTLKEEYYIGEYIINKAGERDKKRDEIKLNGEDKLYLFKKKYNIDIVTPYTIQNLLDEIATKENIKINYTGIKNLDYIITGSVYYEDYKLISLIKEIAEATASNVYIDENNTLIFKPITSTDSFKLTNGDIFELTESDTEINGYNVVTASRIDTDQGTTTEDVYYTELTEDELKDKSKIREYKILANQVIDRDRQPALVQIYEALKNINYIGAELELKGAPFFKPFDRIIINGKAIFIQDFHLSLKSGLSKINCKIETKTETDYKKATVKNKMMKTELFVDKAKGEIQTLIQSQTDIKNMTNKTIQNMELMRRTITSIEEKNEEIEKKQSEIQQNADKLIMEVRSTGGSNLLKNSVLFNNTLVDDIPVGWHLMLGKQPMGIDNIESLSYGCISGRTISNVNGWFMLQQVVTVSTDEYYSFSIRVKKSIDSYVSFYIMDKIAWGPELQTAHTYKRYQLNPGTETNFDLYKIEKIKPISNQLVVSIYIDNRGGNVDFTDIMLNLGETCIPWNTHISEAVSAGVVVDTQGLKVQTGGYDGETRIDGQGLAGYYNNNRIFEINKDLTKSAKFQAEKEITMTPIKVVPVTSGERAGWSFVKN